MSNSERLDPNASSKLPLLTPARTKSGSIKVHQPNTPKGSAGWWSAQCILRGLPASGAIHVKQERLRARLKEPGGHVMMKAFRELEGRLHTEFLVKNARERDEKWALWDEASKIERDPDRFLREGLVVGLDGQPKAVAVKTYGRYKLREAAARIGGLRRWEHEFCYKDSSRWIVLATNEDALHAKVAEVRKLEAEEAKKRNEAGERRQAQMQAQHQKIMADIQERGGHEHRWNIAGERIMELELGMSFSDNEEGTMSISVARNDSGLMQIYADFNFVDVTGVMRLVRPNNESASEPARKQTKASVGYDENVDENDNDEDDEQNAARFEEGFDIPAYLSPRPEAPDWEFRWRGQETGEGEIQLGSDEDLCDISFSGVGGTECEGVLGGAMFSGMKFSGFKIAAANGPLPWDQGVGQVEYRWNSMDAEAYEYARKARWH